MAEHGRDARFPSPRQTRRPPATRGKFGPQGLALALLRALKGKTRSELATATGLETSRIAGYERGEERPTAKSLRKLLQALEATEPEYRNILTLCEQRAHRRPGIGTAGSNEEMADAIISGIDDMMMLFVASRILLKPAGQAFDNLLLDLLRLHSRCLEIVLFRETDTSGL